LKTRATSREGGALNVFANVFAQGNGGITGTVTDESGAKIAGAARRALGAVEYG